MGSARGLWTKAMSRTLAVSTAHHRLRADGPFIALTYDDGPDPVHTPGIMGVLAEQGATATFFVLMTRARRSPSLLRELRAAGHEIALHGPDHRPLSDFASRDTASRLRDATHELQDLTQSPLRHYRPPYGLLTPGGSRAVRANGLRTLLWNRDLQDWTEASEEARIRAATHRIRAGDVLLAHDAHAGPADGAQDGDGPEIDRARLARLVLERLRDHGLAARSAEVLRSRSSLGQPSKTGENRISF